MKIHSARIKRFLGSHIFTEVEALGYFAERSGHRCYLVGGFVRDIILNVPSLDIDIVCAGNINWVDEFARKRNVHRITRSQFNTLKIHFSGDFSFDIARTRKETYPTSASLPVVKPGTIEEDVARRDFTMNTLLLDISRTDFGLILDFHNGLEDISRGLVRILHENSFRDDPTRILRGMRFKNRFSFRFDHKTAQSLKHALKQKFIKRLSPQRIRRELFLILGESTWEKTIRNLKTSGVLSQLGLRCAKTNRAIGLLKSVEREKPFSVKSPELTRLIAMSANASRAALRAFSTITGLRKAEMNLLYTLLKRQKPLLKELSKPSVSNSRIFTLLEGVYDEGLLYLFAVASPRARRRIQYYKKRLQRTKLLITGNDLKKLGIKQGPQFAEILHMVLMGKLDGKTRSKRDELSLAKRISRK